MPDPLVYCQAMAAAAGASVLAALLASRAVRRGDLAHAATLMAFLGGSAVGYYLLETWPAWPPASGLDRFLAIVLPCTVAIEGVARLRRMPRWLGWGLRSALGVSLGRVLLHGSVYLTGSEPQWPLWRAWTMLLASGALLLIVWFALALLMTRRAVGASVPFALAMSLVTAGMAIMLAGYIKGGEAALPLAASLAGVGLAASLDRRSENIQAAAAVALVALFSLLFVGVFFGRLTGGAALVILLAPLACWVTEWSPLRTQKAWIAVALRLLLVAIPLAAVLALAKLDFDRKLAPLMRSGANSLGPNREETT